MQRWGITRALGAAAVAASVAILAAFGTGKDGASAWALGTAWMSATLFLLAFVARPLRQLWRNDGTRWLLANRRYVGVSAAFAPPVSATSTSANAIG